MLAEAEQRLLLPVMEKHIKNGKGSSFKCMNQTEVSKKNPVIEVKLGIDRVKHQGHRDEEGGKKRKCRERTIVSQMAEMLDFTQTTTLVSNGTSLNGVL